MTKPSNRRDDAATIAKACIVAGVMGLGLGVQSSLAQDPSVIELTQTPCQFLESENDVDHGFTTAKKADCDAINAETGAERLATAKVLELKSGKYVFRVTNQNVPYELGFWLREADYKLGNPVHKLTKTSVSGGGLMTGETQDYDVMLEPGEYLYSCPLNPTPNYKLIVS
ncbi:MAG: hypothetical protein R3F54_31390 [Alphaproteobacteria bacterium]